MNARPIFPAVLGLPALALTFTSTPTLARAAFGSELPLGSAITPDHITPEVIGFGWGGALAPATSTILFVNFDGADLKSGCGNNSKNDCSSLSGTFGGKILPYGGDAGLRAAIVQAVRSDVKDFGITVTDSRPPSTEDYAMVLVGNSVYGGPEYHGFAGVAPTIDCGNSNPNITSFSLAASYTSNGMATVINQEAAHTWGLEHVNKLGDNLYPTSGGVSDPKYIDECMKIVSDTMLNPSNGKCNSVHTMFCDFGWQNSYQEMAYLFGPPIADTIAPTLTIDQPSDGAMLPFPAEFDLVITMQDNLSPQVMSTRIFLDDVLAIEGDYAAGTLKFPVKGGVSEGVHVFRVDTTDESGNPASAEVGFTVGQPGGGDTTGATDSAGTDGTNGTSTTSSSDTGDDGAPMTTASSETSDDSSDTEDTTEGTMVDDAGDGGCACRAGAPQPWSLAMGTGFLAFVGGWRRRR